MQFEYISKAALKEYYKNDIDKFINISVAQNVRRNIKESISLADLSKIFVDHKVETIVVYGSRLEYICRMLSKQYHVSMIGVDGIKSVEYCRNRRFSLFCSYRTYFWNAIEAYVNNNEKKIKRMKRKLINYFRQLKPRVLLTTSLSPARIFDYVLYDAAKECSIPIILLEHTFITNAITSREGLKKYLILGRQWIDFYWFWNQRNRDTYIENLITSEERSYVLGYPLRPREKFIGGGGEVSVLFVGEYLPLDNVEAIVDFYTMVNEIYLICQKLDISFKYKGHPKEKDKEMSEYVKKYLDSSICCVDDLFEELKSTYVVVGGRTSALMEAGYTGNCVIQIDWNHEWVKDFIFGHCYLVKDYRHEFEPLIRSIKDGRILQKEISTDEFYQPEDIVLQFNKGLENIESFLSSYNK